MLRVVPVRQTLVSAPVADVAATVRQEVLKVFQGTSIAGKRIAVPVGSRGIKQIALIIRSAIDALKELGANPFIIPAMGSHGHAKPEGQRHVLEHYEVTEASMGVEIRAAMETVRLGTVLDGVPVHWSVEAASSDGVLVIGRVKPHTNFAGKVESGLLKMCVVGLGKRDGADIFHEASLTHGMETMLRAIGGTILGSGKVLGGIALGEDGYGKLSIVRGFRTDELIVGEEQVLCEVKRMMPKLPFAELDLVHCLQLGKNISGSGLDPNVIGRTADGAFRGFSLNREDMTRIALLLASQLTKASSGNGVGFWYPELISRRLFESINMTVTKVNAETAKDHGYKHRMPEICPTDREMLMVAVTRLGRQAGELRGVFVQDTLHLSNMWVTEALLPLVAATPSLSIMGDAREIPYDQDGNFALSYHF